MKLLNHKKSAFIRESSAVNPRLSLPCRPASPRGEQAGAKYSKFFTKKKTIGLGFLIAFIVLTASYFIFYRQTQESQAAEWFNEGWHYRQQFDVFNNSSTEDLLDFQVAIPTSTLTLSTLFTNSKLKSDYTDLRFTDKNGNLLDYWFGTNTSTLNNVYVKIASLPKIATTSIFMYYGNPSASDARNGQNTFLFFDDFNYPSTIELARNNWTLCTNCTVSTTNGWLKIYPDGAADNIVGVKKSTGFGASGLAGKIFEMRAKSVDNLWGPNLRIGNASAEGYSDGTYLQMEQYDTPKRMNIRYNGGVVASVNFDANFQNQIIFNTYTILASSTHQADYRNESTGETKTVLYNTAYGSYTNDNLGLMVHRQSPATTSVEWDYILVRKYANGAPTINATAGITEEIGGGPVGYWKFDEGYGTTAQDSSSYGNDGTLTNMSTSGTSTAWVDGKVNKALMFDGVNDYVDLGKVMNGFVNFSFTLWLKTNQNQTHANAYDAPAIFGTKQGAGSSNDFVLTNDNGVLKWYDELNGSSNTFASSKRINDNVWHQVTVVRTGAALQFFVDGFSVGTDTTGTNGVRNDNLEVARAYWTDPSLNFNGLIDEVKIYNYPLTTSQIKNEYNRGKSVVFGSDQGSKTQGLVGWYKMDESTSTWDGAADTVFDSSGNGNNGTSTGNAKATTTAIYGNAGEFDGDGDYVISATSSGISGDAEFTMEAWIYWTGASWSAGYPSFMGTNATGNVNQGLSFTVRDGKPAVDFWNDRVRATSSLNVRQWYHIAGVKKPGTKLANTKIYVNGVPVAVALENSDAAPNITNAPFVIGRLDATRYFEGLIDDVKFYKIARTPDQIMQDYLEGPGPIAYYNFDEGKGTTANDISGAGHTGTITAGSGGWRQGKIGRAYNFDGANTTIPITNWTTIDDFQSGFSISAWIKPNTMGENSAGRIVDMSVNSLGSYGFSYQLTSDNNLDFNIDNGVHVSSSNNSIVAGVWQHVVLTVRVSGAVTPTTHYVNGVISGTTSNGSRIGRMVGNLAVTIGNRTGGSDRTFDGLIDDLKIYNYVLTPWQIAQEYNGGKPIAQWSLDEGQGSTVYNAYPTSTGALAGTLTNMSVSGTSTAWTSGKMGKALMFDGSNDNIAVPDNSVLGFGSNDFSISAWVKTNALGTTKGFIGKASSLGFGVAGYYMYLGNSGANWCFAVDDATDHTAACDTRQRVTVGSWYHVVAVWNSSAKNSKLYVNGVLAASSTNASVDSYTNSNSFYIGGVGTANGANTRFKGQVDEVRAYNYALSPAQIKQDYNDGASAVLSSLDNGQNIQNALVGYWKMDESTTSWDGAGDTVFDSSGNGNNGIAVGNAKATTTATYGNAGEFDGNGDYITLPTSTASLSGQRQATVSAWVRYRTVTENGCVFCEQTSGASYSRFYTGIDTNGKPIIFYRDATQDPTGSATTVTGNTALSANTWYFLTYLYDSDRDVVEIYINGSLDKRSSAVLTPFGTSGTNGLSLGSWTGNANNEFDGLIDDVKVYSVARTPDQIMADYLNGPGPMSYYNFEENRGTVLGDKSFQAYNGTITPGTGSWISGKIGRAYNFDGAASRVSMGTSNIITSQNFSFSFWIKYRNYTEYDRVLHKYADDGLGLTGYAIWEALSGSAHTLCLYTGYHGTNRWTYGPSTISLDDGKWHFVAITANRKGSAIIYVDGVPGTATTITTVDGDLSNSTNFVLGYQGGVNYMDGALDEFKIYNYVLTPWQIAQEYNSGKPIGYWKMDDGQGSRVSDYSGNGYHGTLSLSGSPATSSAWQASSNCKLNGCLSFDGSNDLVNLGDYRSSFTNTVSVCSWVTADVAGTYPMIFSGAKAGAAGSEGFELRLYNTTGIPSFNVDASLGRINTTLGSSIVGGGFQHVCGTYDGASVKIYVNGILKDSQAQNGNINFGAAGSNWRIGDRGTVGGYPWDGKIDEVKIFNYALSPAQIKNDYNMGKGIFFK